MRFSIAAAVAFAAGAIATTPSPSFTTEIVTDYTTWCPEATVLTHGSQTYTVAQPTSLVLSSGPYTVSRPLLSKTVTYCNKCAGPTAPAGSPSPIASSASIAPVYSGSAVVVPSNVGSNKAGSTASSAVSAAYTGAASRHVVGAGAGLTAVLGLAAFLL